MSEKQPIGPRQSPDPAQWVDDHGDALYRYALLRVKEVDAAEDLVQETFLAALRAREQFAGASSVRTWLVGILKHKIVDHLRRQSREQPVSSSVPAGGSWEELFDAKGGWYVKPSEWAEDPSAVLEKQEFWETFRRCLSRLPPRLGQAFALREMDELRSDEVCQVLNVSASNLWVMLHRARMQLWRCLESNWFGVKAEGT
jgi:RNA polymerase sigma-70 factor (ECF subfamily)